MNYKKYFTRDTAKEIGDNLKVDWNNVYIRQFHLGLNIELEHGLIDSETNITNNDPNIAARIVLTHLKEVPDYYTRLYKMQKEAESFWGKYSIKNLTL